MFALWGAVGKWAATGLRASGVVTLALAITLIPPRACADSEVPRNEIFTGFEASDNSASAYLGGGYAFGKGLYAPGWRVRAVASLRPLSTMTARCSRWVSISARPSSTASEIFGSALVGYQFHAGGR